MDHAKNEAVEKEVRRHLQLVVPLSEMIRGHLHEFVIARGMEALEVLLEQERAELCGPRYGRGRESAGYRAGTAPSSLVMGGRKVTVRRPRVRGAEGEMNLPSWEHFSGEDPLTDRTMEQMMVGVSTRKYDRSLETTDAKTKSRSTSKSSVSRRFVAATEEQLRQWFHRDLRGIPFCAFIIDGIHIHDHVVLIAIGLDENGDKHPVGLWMGATENATVCREMLAELVERGVDPLRSYLFVIDGSKGLRKAIRDMFGDRALVQRCQVHKRRNVKEHLPKSMQASVDQVMREAYRSDSSATAKRRLTALASQLEDEHPHASRSLLEGLDETLTIVDMGLRPSLRRTLSTTNPIENVNGRMRDHLRRVKRWRDGKMVLRWVGAALKEIQKSFRKMVGYRDLPKLVAALRRNDLRFEDPRFDQEEHVA